jgi:hypothetical protein
MGFQVHFLTRYGKLQNNSLHFHRKKSKSIPEQLIRLKGMGMTWWFQTSKFLTGPVAYFLESSRKIKEGSIFGHKFQKMISGLLFIINLQICIFHIDGDFYCKK